MPQELPFRREQVRSLAENVARETNLPELRHAFVEAKLIAKETSPGDLKRRLPDPQKWVQEILKALEDAATFSRGLRAFAGAIKAYVEDSRLDPRIRESLRKALVAADQQKIQGLQRNVDKLREYAGSTGRPELSDPLQLVFFAAASERARDFVLLFINGQKDETAKLPEKEPAQVVPRAPSILERAPAAQGKEGAAVEPVPMPSAGAAVLDSLVRELRVIKSAEPPASPSWTWSELESLVPVPSRAIQWPTASTLTRDISASAKEFRLLFAGFPTDGDPSGSVFDWIPVLDGLAKIGQSAKTLQEKTFLYLRECQGAAADILVRGGRGAKEEAEKTLRMFDSLATARAGITNVENLLKRREETGLERRKRLLELAHAIHEQCRWLDARGQATTQEGVRSILRGAGESGLQNLAQRTQHDARANREGFEKKQAAAEKVLEYLTTNGTRIQVSKSVAASVTEHVVNGKTQDALGMLGKQIKQLATVEKEKVTQASARDTDTTIPAVEQQTAPRSYSLPGLDDSSFVPRDPITRAYLTADSKALPILLEVNGVSAVAEIVKITSLSPQERRGRIVDLLLWRATQEISRPSVLRAADNCMDLLLLAAKAGRPGEELAHRVLGLLAATRPRFERERLSPEQLTDRLVAIAFDGDEGAIQSAIGELFELRNLPQVIGSRLVRAELMPFADQVIGTLVASARADEHSAEANLQAVAMGIGWSARLGMTDFALSLLLQLAGMGGLEKQTQASLEARLRNPRQRRPIPGLPDWLQVGLKEFELVTDAPPTPKKTGDKGLLHVQIPVSVTRHKGFSFRSGDDRLQMALLVGNPAESGRFAMDAEIIFRKSNKANSRWLAEDAFVAVGSLGEDERFVVPVLLKLKSELTADVTGIDLEYEVHWIEPHMKESQQVVSTLNVPLAKAVTLRIQEYEGASGKPLEFNDRLLASSVPASIRRAFEEVRKQLLEEKEPATVMIVGRRRRGKTSILRTLMRDKEIERRYICILHSQETEPLRSRSEVFKELGGILERAAARLGVDIAGLAEDLEAKPEWNVVQRWMEALEGKIKTDCSVLIMVDEFQKWVTLLSTDDRRAIFTALRGLHNRPSSTPPKISIVLSGLSNLREYSKASMDFKTAFKLLQIEPCSLGDTQRLLRSNETIEFDTRVFSEVQSLSGGNPFLINVLGKKLSAHLQREGRTYCLAEDVRYVFEDELDDESSNVRSFIEYLLKQDEEDHAAEIEEIPSLIALAWTIAHLGHWCSSARIDDIQREMALCGIACDSQILRQQLGVCAENELLDADGERFSFRMQWLREWLEKMHSDRPVPIEAKTTSDLVLKRYRVERKLHQGGQASIFLANDRLTNVNVVLKVYTRAPGQIGPSVVESEIDALKQLNHESIIQCQDYGHDAERGADVLVFPWVKDSRSLAEIGRSENPEDQEIWGRAGTLQKQIEVIRQLVGALTTCHAAGVVHKDIKPENILIRRRQGVWFPTLIDFGLAARRPENADPETPTRGPFTPRYVAPERYRGEARLQPADMYSLGVVAYELLAGVHPFPNDMLEAREAQVCGRFVPLQERRPDVPRRLSDLVATLLCPDPRQRPTASTLDAQFAVIFEKQDWQSLTQHGDSAYCDKADPAEAYEYWEKAAFLAAPEDRQNEKYLDMLSNLLDAAHDCTKILSLAPSLLQIVAGETLKAPEYATKRKADLLYKFSALILKQVVDSTTGTREVQRGVVRSLVETLLDNPPTTTAVSCVNELTSTPADTSPVLWDLRDDVFLLGCHYASHQEFEPALVRNCCVIASRKIRQSGGSLIDCQTWLQRARLRGAEREPSFQKEDSDVQAAIRLTAKAIVLPPPAKRQNRHAVGEDEKGHFDVKRFERWEKRLLDLYAFVEEVRRIRGDHKLAPSPTRILSDRNLPFHLKNIPATMNRQRVIPAFLDSSYNIKDACGIRINIILPEGTTAEQREAAVERLRADDSLFGTE